MAIEIRSRVRLPVAPIAPDEVARKADVGLPSGVAGTYTRGQHFDGTNLPGLQDFLDEHINGRVFTDNVTIENGTSPRPIAPPVAIRDIFMQGHTLSLRTESSFGGTVTVSGITGAVDVRGVWRSSDTYQFATNLSIQNVNGTVTVSGTTSGTGVSQFRYNDLSFFSCQDVRLDPGADIQFRVYGTLIASLSALQLQGQGTASHNYARSEIHAGSRLDIADTLGPASINLDSGGTEGTKNGWMIDRRTPTRPLETFVRRGEVGEAGITALTRDVTASGQGSVVATVERIQNRAVNPMTTAPAVGNVLKWTGAEFAPQPESGAGGITGLRSNPLPMIYRLPFNWTGSSILGAMDTLSSNVDGNRVWYFTSHATQALSRGARRTINDPRMVASDWLTPMSCPMNFGTTLYRGNWCRWESIYNLQQDDTWTYVEYVDFDGIVFTSGNTALWIRRKYPGNDTIEQSVITLQGLPVGQTAGQGGVWAGRTATENLFWVIMGTSLYRARFTNGTTYSWDGGSDHALGGIYAQPRRIVGPQSFPFSAVTDGALPTLNTNSCVYAEGRYAAVWGTAAPANRIAYFNGSNWYELTAPFNFAAPATNCVIIFSNGTLGVYNNSNGDYYTVSNPTAGADATWDLRFRTVTNRLLTRGFLAGSAQFLPRGGASSVVYAQFDSGSDDGGKCYVNPDAETAVMNWPNQLYCSTSRPDIVPSTAPSHGYAYAYGTKTTYATLLGDGFTSIAQANGTPFTTVFPPNLEPALPTQRVAPVARRVGPFTWRDDATRRVMTGWVANPVSVL